MRKTLNHFLDAKPCFSQNLSISSPKSPKLPYCAGPGMSTLKSGGSPRRLADSGGGVEHYSFQDADYDDEEEDDGHEFSSGISGGGGGAIMQAGSLPTRRGGVSSVTPARSKDEVKYPPRKSLEGMDPDPHSGSCMWPLNPPHCASAIQHFARSISGAWSFHRRRGQQFGDSEARQGR